VSTEERDFAQRCDRCQRVTLGTREVRWEVNTGLREHVAMTWRLCRRCRTDVTESLRYMIREAVAR